MTIIATDIAQEAHKHCLTNEHEFDMHMFTSSHYARSINENQLQVTPKQVIDAIIVLAGDPKKGEWTRHPHPNDVIIYLNALYGPIHASGEG